MLVNSALIQLANLSGLLQPSFWNWMESRFLWQVGAGSSESTRVALVDSHRTGRKLGFVAS